MPLHIERVEADLNITPSAETGAPAAPSAGGAAPGQAVPLSALLEKLRPIIVEILQEELARFQRRQG